MNSSVNHIMKHVTIILILIVSATTPIAFSDDSMPTISDLTAIHKQTLGVPFVIQLNQTAYLDKFQLKLNDIKDSRCHSDVTCIWKGQAILTFDIHNNTRDESFSFVTGKVATHYVDSYEITLNGIASYPISTRDIPEEYVAKLTTSKNNRERLPPPLKQINIGISLNDIQCNTGKVLIVKPFRLEGACVYEDSLPKLIQRGWALAKNERGDLSSPMMTEKKNIVNGPKINIAVKIIDGEKYLVFHGYGWNMLHNVEITIANGDRQITSIRSKTNENGMLYLPWLLPDRLPPALYEIHATDGVNQNDSTISIPLGVSGTDVHDSSGMEVRITGEKQVRRGTTHVIEVQVNRDTIPVNDAQVFISIENYGEDIIRKFHGRTDQQGHFIFSWEIPKTFDDVETLLAFVDVTDGISSKTEMFKFNVYCLPGEKNCNVRRN